MSSVPTWRPDAILAPLRRTADSAVWRLTLAFAAPLALGVALFVTGTYVLMVTDDAKATKAAVDSEVAIANREAHSWNDLTGWVAARLPDSRANGMFYRLAIEPDKKRPIRVSGDPSYLAPPPIECGYWFGWGPCVRDAKDERGELWFYVESNAPREVVGLAKRVDVSRYYPNTLNPNGTRAPTYLYVGSLSEMADVEAGMLDLARWVLGLAVLVALGVGFLVSRRIVRRVEALNIVCDQVRLGELGARASEDGADEFSELARHVNTMLEQINSLVHGLQDVSNRIAHDLRTPLARLKSDLERAAQATQLEQARTAVEAAAAETEEILATFQALLDITEAEAGADAGLKPIDLAQTANAAVELYEAVADEAGVRLELEAAPARILGEPSLMVRLVANLVDNAIKFSPRGGAVQVSVRRADGAVVLCVQDSGPGIPAQERERVFKRFVRGEATRATPGHGLGLPLVAAIAKRHGARIRLGDAAPGLTVTVEFRAL